MTLVWCVVGILALVAAAIWFSSRKPEDHGMSSGVVEKTKRWRSK